MFINCKNRKKQNRISLAICLFLICLLSGCESRKTAGESNGSQITLTPIAKPSDDKSEPTNDIGESDRTEEADSNKNEIPITLPDASIATEDPKIEDFSKMDEYFKDYTFDVWYDEKLLLYQRTYSIHGEYDLDGDGEADRINAVLKYDDPNGNYIEVNGIRMPLDRCWPTGEIRIIDLDSKDNYVEIAIFNDGVDGVPNNLAFFRYDGKELYSLEYMDRDALMDGQGKFISWFDIANYIKPQFFSAWEELKNNKFVRTNHDVEQNLGKTYELDGTFYFVPLDKKPENIYEYTVWESEALREFKAAKIKLLDIYFEQYDRSLNWFYVELPDGERGLLYFYYRP